MNELKLIPNEQKYWEFIRELRFHPNNLSGFVISEEVTTEQQIEYMKKYNDTYFICLDESENPVGFIGEVDNDIRLAVHPDSKGKGIGKYMLNEFMKTHPFATAKILSDNTASLKTFYSCGFISHKFDGKFFYLTKTEHGYYKIKHNPYKIVRMFEESIADYTGAPYAISVDSCTNALFLCCKYLEVKDVMIPSKTYLSVPESIMQAGGNVIFDTERNNWTGTYQLKPYPIWDSAKRLTSNMYIPGSFMCLSFHIKKTLKIGKGGIILTDDENAVEWFKKARYEGRSEKLYKEDNIQTEGWNMYMTPQQAAHGLCLLQNYPLHVPDLGEENGYSDLRQFDLFSKCDVV
jgi:GNAT superfamily N-acetyltransferase